MKISYRTIFLFYFLFAFQSCKKKEERDLIKHYIGNYSVTRIQTTCCDSLWHTITTVDNIELELKKSFKGIKIKGVSTFVNFDVNYPDSIIYANNRNSEKYAYGKFFSNDSISLTVALSSKVPNYLQYCMKKK